MVSKNKVWIVFAVLVLLIGYFSLSSTEESVADYVARIQDHRAQQAYFLQHSEESPFANPALNFSELKFYDIDIKYKVRAKVYLFEEEISRTIVTNTGEKRQYKELGWAHFDWNEAVHKLLIFQAVDSDELFVGFKDATSGLTTYGAGRYIETETIKDGHLIIDFNKAYNPYCAYSDEFSCPLPPKENSLNFKIEAGEQRYK